MNKNPQLTHQLIADLRRIRCDAEKPRVLIVEDEQSVAFTMQRLLGLLGCETVIDDGLGINEEFLRNSSKRPDLVFLDLRLPGTCGVEVLRTLKTFVPMVPVVIVTGYPNSDLLVEAAELGYIGIITKPFTIVSLAEVLTKHNFNCKLLTES